MKERIPIMSEDDEKFMAFCGVIQWAQGVIEQLKRVVSASERLSHNPGNFPASLYSLHCERHYFVIATYKFLEYRDWARGIGLFADIDFSEIDNIPHQDIKDLRNMREHIVDYFKGGGRNHDRWVIETPEFKADASSCVGNMIGGRLDYLHFGNAVERIFPALQKSPIPYPRTASTPKN